jgi:tetratricopeptide (TPR) repeat protein
MLTLDKHVLGLREDGFFVLWGDGSVGRIPLKEPPSGLKAMFTYDAGEPFSALDVSMAATAEPQVEPAAEESTGPNSASGTGTGATAQGGAPSGTPGTGQPLASNGQHSEDALPATSVQRERMPLPDPLSLKTARDLVREIYEDDYESAKADRDRAQLADRLLQRAEQVSGDHAGQYVLLEIAMNIATQVGNSTTALSALQKLVSRYQVDELVVSSDVLTQLAKSDRSRTGVTAVLDRCERLVDMALRQDHFDKAENLCTLALGAARQLDDREKMADLAERRKEIDEARDAYQTVQKALVSVTNADDPATCLEAGRYYCFVKTDWEVGLPLLLKGSDPRLRELAEADMRLPTIAGEQLELGDGWWELGERDKAHRKALHMRAAHWYAQAVKTLPSGLFRVKAEMRVQQVKREYGQNAANSAVSGQDG